jgi:sugar transferase (PEP-CTERM system associated)
MFRLFRHYIPKSLFFLGLIEAVLLALSLLAALYLRYWMIGDSPPHLSQHVAELAAYVIINLLMMLALGLYQHGTCLDRKVVAGRLLVSFALSFVVMSAAFYAYPTILIWRSVFLIAIQFSFIAILGARTIYSAFADHSRFKRRVLVLGAGSRAKSMLSLRSNDISEGYLCVAFLRMSRDERAIPEAQDFETIISLSDYARELAIDEIVIATEERRGKLPVKDLLTCRLGGISVIDYSTFVERETGQVDLDSLNPSWLIFSDGFVGGRIDHALKRSFDVVVSLMIVAFSLPILIVTALAILVTDPGPIFYRQQRIGQHGRAFNIIKFRSMRVDAERDSGPKWAGVNDPRITPIGQIIRATRIDEIPQVLNVLTGDMSFVGPRPERGVFVDALTDEIPYYSERHHVKPGITGWAQLNYPYGASVEDARKKLQYDLYYVKNYSIFLDLLIIIQTVRVVLWPHGVR